ncbi:MAG: DUF2149 domain-containing protein [Solirubrobacteraceae bacterium]|jgi:hypothetical protein
MSRVGLGRHGQLDSDVGDPLDGLVNMFDLGLVLAVAFLVAGLSLASKDSHKNPPKTPTTEQTLTTPSAHQSAAGQGRAVGQVYQLPNGQLVLVKPKRSNATGTP